MIKSSKESSLLELCRGGSDCERNEVQFKITSGSDEGSLFYVVCCPKRRVTTFFNKGYRFWDILCRGYVIYHGVRLSMRLSISCAIRRVRPRRENCSMFVGLFIAWFVIYLMIVGVLATLIQAGQ